MDRNMNNDIYRILIADDDPMTQRLLDEYFRNLGYEVTAVMDGNTALAEIRRCHYDILISDMIMPGIDGIELIKTIKNMDGFDNLPVILLSGKNDTFSKVKAFEALADDYVTKPFDFDELGARTKTQIRLKHLQEELEDKNMLLNDRNMELEAHLDIARHIQRRLLPLDTEEIYGLKVRSFFQPIDKVGGDIFDLIPLGNGKVGIFIGDVSGHGVAATFLSLILKLTVQSIAKEEVSPSKVLERLNSALVKWISDEDFSTALYGIVDTNLRLLYFASAGHPKGILIRSGDKRVEPLDSKGFCLGIQESVTYTASIVSLYPGDRIIYYTDGFIERRDSKGRILGTERFFDIVARYKDHDIDRILSCITDEIEDICGGRKYEDDLTMLCLEIRDSFFHSYLVGHLNTNDVIDRLVKPLASGDRIDSGDFKKVKVALSEALYNAIEHGCLELPSSLIESDYGETVYEKMREERMANPSYAKRKITASYIIDGNRITYLIKDAGAGFDYKNLSDPTSPQNITKCYGRGITLIKMLMDEVSFNEKGNEIRLIKNLSV